MADNSLIQDLLTKGKLSAPAGTEAADRLRDLFALMKEQGHALAFESIEVDHKPSTIAIYHYLTCERCKANATGAIDE